MVAGMFITARKTKTVLRGEVVACLRIMMAAPISFLETRRCIGLTRCQRGSQHNMPVQIFRQCNLETYVAMRGGLVHSGTINRIANNKRVKKLGEVDVDWNQTYRNGDGENAEKIPWNPFL